ASCAGRRLWPTAPPQPRSPAEQCPNLFAVSAASLNNTQGIVALAALAVALLALIACVVLMGRVHSLRAAQKLVLGNGSQQDVIAHSASLQEAFQALQEYVGDLAQHLDNRLDSVQIAL